MTTVAMPPVLETDYGIRPAGRPDECFYCHQKIGARHLETCVTISKRVRVRVTLEYEMSEPFSWSDEDIEHHLNDSSWCASNVVRHLSEYVDSLEANEQCLCWGHGAKFEVLAIVDPGPLQEEPEDERESVD